MENKNIMKQAKESLKGKWGISIAACLIVTIIAILASLFGGYFINKDWGGNFLSLLITPPLGVGLALFFININDGKTPKIKTLFNPFQEVWLNSVLAYFLMTITIFIGFILLFVPGIVAYLMFSQVLYIIAEDKEIGPYDSLVKSKKMMQGNKWKLFKIQMTILVLALVCILTLGIGFIWLAPYQNAVYAKFYKEVKDGTN